MSDREQTQERFDVLVLGAGSGGYVAAIRAAQLGLSVAVVEERYWGGVCLNVGCIPAKALIHQAELAQMLTEHAADHAIVGAAHVDYAASWRLSRQVVDTSSKGVHFLMRKNRITEIDGRGMLTGRHGIDVTGPDGAVTSYRFDDLIIATGATVRTLPGVELSDNVVSYEELILTDRLPRSIVIGGSGAIGVEFAYILRSFGVEVTIVEYADRMVPTEDPDVSAELLRQSRAQGIRVRLGTAVARVEDVGTGVRVHVNDAAGAEVLEADKFLAAFGFAPRTTGYGLENTGVRIGARGGIEVDARGRTATPGVYAVGDCTGLLMLAHTAEAMGVIAAETIAGAPTMDLNVDMIPRVTFTQPQIASFGYTAQQARDRGHEVIESRFPISANGRARATGQTRGFVKIIADAEHHELLGAHLIGAAVSELLPPLTLAQQWDLTADEIARNVFAHPTFGEAVKEAVEGIAGHMINL